jgi:RHS repeat-associated protein
LLLNDIVYEPFGPIGGWTWGNGTLAVRTYDLDGRVSHVDSAGLRAYTWDDADRITDILDAQNSSLNQSYGYDDLDRLTSVIKTGGNQSFTYDANGNRLSYVDSAANSAYVVSPTSNRLSSITGSQARTYTYNNDGSVATYGNTVFEYSDRGRLGAATVGGTKWDYYLNSLGQRVRKKLAPSGNHFYVYDEVGHLIGEYSGNTLIQETVWLGDIPVATLRGSAIYYVHTDHLNAPRMVTQPSNNAIRWRWDRDPFGTTAPNQNPSGLGTFSYNLRLPGQFYDAETGLHYNYFRDYDPAIGRYVQSDPVGLAGGVGTYSYVSGNPVTYMDPRGLWQWHGNWGGPGWGGGRPLNEENATDEDLANSPAVDARDLCYWNHDRCILNCHQDSCIPSGYVASCERKCDHQVARCLRAISLRDPSAWRLKRGGLADHLIAPAAAESLYFDLFVPLIYHGGALDLLSSGADLLGVGN